MNPDDTIPCPRFDTLPPDTLPDLASPESTEIYIADDGTIDLTSEVYED